MKKKTISKNKTKKMLEIVEEGQLDTYDWIDTYHYTSVNNRTEAELIEFDCDDNLWSLPEPFHGTCDTFIIYYPTFTLSRYHFTQLFEEVKNYNIRRLIFSCCRFDYGIEGNLPNSVEEVIFSSCTKIDDILLSILSYRNYKFKRIIFRNVNLSHTVISILENLYIFLNYNNNYVKKIELINCEKVNRNQYKQYDDNVSKVEKVLKRNENGYLKCATSCVILFFIKKRKLSSLFTNLDINVIKIITAMIWKTRYGSLWHDKNCP